MKMIPTKTIFNVTEDQEIVRVQWTKKKLWPFAIVDMCAQVLISWFLLRPESLQFVIKKTYYSSLFIFVSKGIHVLYLLPSKCLTFFLQYDSLMPSNLYLAVNT